MTTEQPELHEENEKKPEEPEQGQLPFYLLPTPVQLRNIFAIEILAKRFPMGANRPPNAQINLEGMEIDNASLHANVILNVKVDFADEPRLFEISFKLLGEFVYPQEYATETLRQFLAQGSMSVMMPFARELLLSLCNRLQIPPLILQMIELAPAAFSDAENKDAPK